MKTFNYLILILFSFSLAGCSIPSSAKTSELYSFTKVEKTKKVRMGAKRKATVIKDFRENEMYDEDITALKEEVEIYIAAHPDLSETVKNDLRSLKVTEGMDKEKVELLLGEPDKIAGSGSATEVWIYAINRIRAFTVFIVPVFIAREGYYLRFKDNTLTAIERHYPKQMVHQASGPGLDRKTGPEK